VIAIAKNRYATDNNNFHARWLCAHNESEAIGSHVCAVHRTREATGNAKVRGWSSKHPTTGALVKSSTRTLEGHTRNAKCGKVARTGRGIEHVTPRIVDRDDGLECPHVREVNDRQFPAVAGE